MKTKYKIAVVFVTCVLLITIKSHWKSYFPSFNALGIPEITWENIHKDTRHENQTYVYVTDLDSLVKWLLKYKPFSEFDSSGYGDSIELRNSIISHLNHSGSCYLSQDEIRIGKKQYFTTMRCEYHDDEKNTDNLKLTIKLYKGSSR